MKKKIFRNPILVALATMFVIFVSSCGQSESARKQGEKARQIERQKQISDSTTKAEADSAKARAERPYDFVPQLIMATKENERDDICGEGGYKCHLYEADVYFYKDSTDEASKVHVRLFCNISVDGKERTEEETKSLNETKRAYQKMVNTAAENLLITYNPKTGRTIVRENLPPQKRKTVGKALLMEHVDNLIWQSSY